MPFLSDVLFLKNYLADPLNIPAQNNKGYTDFSLGSGHLLLKSGDDVLYSMGDNKYGQCGVDRKACTFVASPVLVKSNKKDPFFCRTLSSGFQYSLAIDSKPSSSGNWTLHGFGRRNWNQYLAAGLDVTNVAIDSFDFPKPCSPIQTASKLTHISTGFNHSVYVLDARQVFCTGFNFYGQCGASNLQSEIVERYREVEVPLEEGEKVAQVVSGLNHNLLLTTRGRVFFWGNVTQNQFPSFGKKYGQGLVYSGPILVDLPLENEERPVKIKAAFNRSSIFLNSGRVLVMGGEDTSFYYGLPSLQILDVSQEFRDQGLEVKDVALGLWHSVLVAEPKQ